MHWKTKAKIQNLVSILPSAASYAAYYWVQRNFGALRRINPIFKLKTGVETWKKIHEVGYNPADKTFFEVGTGRVPLVPLSYWLMGAKSIITIDLNPYIKDELIRESLEYISKNSDEILKAFGNFIDEIRLEELLRFHVRLPFRRDSFLDLCQIKYIAPGDATKTGLKENSIDFHTSNVVLEHIPPNVLIEILEEGNRIISNDGLFVHEIDYSDHFSYTDKTISTINFLQYSDVEWKKYAGNKYMYMNRLRHDDFLAVFASMDHRILLEIPWVDEQVRQLLISNTLQLNERFKEKPQDVLSIVGSWIVSKKIGNKHSTEFVTNTTGIVA